MTFPVTIGLRRPAVLAASCASIPSWSSFRPSMGMSPFPMSRSGVARAYPILTRWNTLIGHRPVDVDDRLYESAGEDPRVEPPPPPIPSWSGTNQGARPCTCQVTVPDPRLPDTIRRKTAHLPNAAGNVRHRSSSMAHPPRGQASAPTASASNRRRCSLPTYPGRAQIR